MLMRRKRAVRSGYARSLGEFYAEDEFHRFLGLERKRKERSKERCAIVLVDVTAFDEGQQRARIVERIVSALRLSTREIDLKGWYREGEIVGILFSEIPDTSGPGLEGVVGRIRQQFSPIMDNSEIQGLTISCRSISDQVELAKPANH